MTAPQTTRYCLQNPEPLPTPANGAILHFVPDTDSAFFVEFAQDCSTYLPLRRFHDESQSLVEIGEGTIRANVPVMVCYVSALGYYVLGGMPDNNQFAGWHESAAASPIGEGTEKRHYRDFAGALTLDLSAKPRTGAVFELYNGSVSGTINLKFSANSGLVTALWRSATVLVDWVVVAGGLLKMVGTANNEWRIVEDTLDTGGPIGPAGPAGPTGPQGDPGGATLFTELTDTPADYAGFAGRVVKVNPGETAMEFDYAAVVDVNGQILTPTGATAGIAFGTSALRIVNDGADRMAFHSSDGFERYTLDGYIFASEAAGGPELVGESSTYLNPTLVPNNAHISSGIGGSFGDVSVIAVGVEGIRVTNTLGTVLGDTLIDLKGSVTLTTGYTIATLPAPVLGREARITDGDAALAWGATAVNSGAGATPYRVWYDGTAWKIFAGGPASVVDSVQFNLAAGISVAQGQMAWNADEETVDLGLNGAVLQLGQETHYHVRNNTGVLIADGAAVMATGTIGGSGRITVGLMDGSNVANAKYFLGLATEDIADGTDGKISSFGKVRGIKTDYPTWADEQVLWVDNATPGGLTNVQPTSACRLPVAFIVHTHAVNGVLAVRATEGTTLSEAHDTAISSPSNGQVLTYNGTAWANAAGPAFVADVETQITPVTPIVLDAASGIEKGFDLSMTVNQTGTAGYDVDYANVTETGTGSGTKYLLRRAVGGVDKFFVTNDGDATALGKQISNVATIAANDVLTDKDVFFMGAQSLTEPKIQFHSAGDSISYDRLTDTFHFKHALVPALSLSAALADFTDTPIKTTAAVTALDLKAVATRLGFYTVDTFERFYMEGLLFAANAAAGPALITETATYLNPTLLPDKTDVTAGIGGNNGDVSVIAGSLEGIRVVNTGAAIETVFSDDVIRDVVSGEGTKIGDATTSDFGWRDILGAINVRGIGVTDPTWTQIAATGFWDYAFDVNDVCWINFHMPHDYVPGTDIHFHVHWLANGTNVNTVKWQFTFAYADGFGNGTFPLTTPTVVTAEEAGSGTAYDHMITETAAVTIAGLEVDGIIKCKITRITNGGTDNTDGIFLQLSDIHYQSTNLPTKNKAPDFYT